MDESEIHRAIKQLGISAGQLTSAFGAMVNALTLPAQLLAATNDQTKCAAIINTINAENLPGLRWAEEIRFEIYLAATGLPRADVALDTLKSSSSTDVDLDIYNARLTRTF